jgi:hypothetical protein
MCSSDRGAAILDGTQLRVKFVIANFGKSTQELTAPHSQSTLQVDMTRSVLFQAALMNEAEALRKAEEPIIRHHVQLLRASNDYSSHVPFCVAYSHSCTSPTY